MESKLKRPHIKSGYDHLFWKRKKTKRDWGDSLTQQSFREDCNINSIMDKAKRTGYMSIVSGGNRKPIFGDFTQINDYHSACTMIAEAQDGFLELPASIRARFENNPQKLLEWLSDDENRKEAIELGIIDPPEDIPEVKIVQNEPEKGVTPPLGSADGQGSSDPEPSASTGST